MESIILKLRCFAKKRYGAARDEKECRFEKTLVRKPYSRRAETPTSEQPSL
jgi:hypothetical protein